MGCVNGHLVPVNKATFQLFEQFLTIFLSVLIIFFDNLFFPFCKVRQQKKETLTFPMFYFRIQILSSFLYFTFFVCLYFFWFVWLVLVE